MAKMRQMDVKEQAKAQALKAIEDGTFFEKAEKVGVFTYAYPTEFDINGDGVLTEVWVEMEITSKNWYDTTKTKAYDPFAKASEYADTIAAREQREKERAEAKAKKLAKAQEKAKE